MKKVILLILLYAVLIISVLAQNQGIGYQAILRNTEGDPIANETVTVLVSLLPSSETGVSPLFTEFHIAETNDFGLINLEVGRGVAQGASFSSVDWSSGSMFIEVSIDEDDGNNFQLVGTRELLAVPYALYAANAEQSVQTLSRSGDLIALSNGGGSFTDQVNDADADATNEIQDLQLDGNLLSITGNENASTIDLSSFAGGGSTITEEEVDEFVANNGYLTSETDDQALTLADNTLTLEDGGTVDLSAYLDDTDTQLTEVQVDDFVANNGYLTSETDDQALTLADNTLTLEDGGTVDLSAYLDDTDTRLTETQVDDFVANNGYLTSETDDQALTLADNTLTLEDGGTVDLSAYLDDTDTQLTEVQVDDFVANNGYLTSETDDQALTLADNTLTLEDGGTVDLSAYLDDTDTQLTEAQVDAFANNNGYLTSFTEVDGDVTNEIQDLNLSGDNLTITNNSSATNIDLSAYKDNTDAQTLSLTGSSLAVSGGNSVDLAPLTSNSVLLTDAQSIAGEKTFSDGIKTSDVTSPATVSAVLEATGVIAHSITSPDGSGEGSFRMMDDPGDPTPTDFPFTGDIIRINNKLFEISRSERAGPVYFYQQTRFQTEMDPVTDDQAPIVLVSTVPQVGNIQLHGKLMVSANFSTLIYPSEDGTTGQVMTTDGSGNITFQDASDSQLTEAQVDAFANNNGYLTSFSEVDGDATNEIQDLTLIGNELKVTNNASATAIDLSGYLDNTDTQLTEAQVDAFANNNGYLTSFTEVDGDVTNEIQDLNLSGDNLTITNNTSATTVDLSTYKDNTDAQSLSLTGSNLSISGGNSVDLDPIINSSVQLNGDQIASGVKTFSDGIKLTSITSSGASSATTTPLAMVISSVGIVPNNVGDQGNFQLNIDPVSSDPPRNPVIGETVRVNGKDFVITQITRGGFYWYDRQVNGLVVDATDIGAAVSRVDAASLGNILLTGNLQLTNGASTITLPSADGNSGQVLTTDGNGIVTFQDAIVDTKLTESEVDAFANNNGYLTSFTEVDGDATNEIQDLNLTGDNLTITNNSSATNIDLSTYKDNTDAQTLSLSGSQLSISGGNNVDLPEELPATIGTAGQVLAVNSAADGVEWTTASGNGSGVFTQSGSIISAGGATDDLVFGSTSLNDISGTDDDNRLFYDKSKGSFRAGSATGTQWNDASAGTYSAAFGQNTTASGSSSTALGSGNVASGQNALATGANSTASEFAATAFGTFTSASGNSSAAFGTFSSASGSASFASGTETRAASQNEFAIGAYNTIYTPANDNTDRAFSIGNGTILSRSDAFTVYKNGALGLLDFSTSPTTTANRLYSVNGALHYNGSEVGSGGSGTTYATETGTTHTVPAGHTDYFLYFTSGGAGKFNCTVTMPSAPSVGDKVTIARQFVSNPASMEISFGNSNIIINGLAKNSFSGVFYMEGSQSGSISLEYITGTWVIHRGSLEAANF